MQISWGEIFKLVLKFILDYIQERKDLKNVEVSKQFENTERIKNAILNRSPVDLVHSVGLSIVEERETSASKGESGGADGRGSSSKD